MILYPSFSLGLYFKIKNYFGAKFAELDIYLYIFHFYLTNSIYNIRYLCNKNEML